jgi:hypothetical protein
MGERSYSGGKEQGVVVLTACSQAGVVNVLRHARGCFPELPLYGVMGGFHLSGTNERVIPETVDAMREFDLAVTAAAHCTGWRATGALASTFGDAVVPSPVGSSTNSEPGHNRPFLVYVQFASKRPPFRTPAPDGSHRLCDMPSPVAD